jgi:hypothetical protein
MNVKERRSESDSRSFTCINGPFIYGGHPNHYPGKVRTDDFPQSARDCHFTVYSFRPGSCPKSSYVAAIGAMDDCHAVNG